MDRIPKENSSMTSYKRFNCLPQAKKWKSLQNSLQIKFYDMFIYHVLLRNHLLKINYKNSRVFFKLFYTKKTRKKTLKNHFNAILWLNKRFLNNRNNKLTHNSWYIFNL